MTASLDNTNSAIRVLERTIRDLRCHHGAPRVATSEWHLAALMDSVKKCFVSLAAQIRFYEGAKGTGRALIVEQDDGTHEVVSGQFVAALRLPLPDLGRDAVIYGAPETLRMVASALAKAGWPADGPASVHDLAGLVAAKGSTEQ